MKNLISRTYWDSVYEDVEYKKLHENDPNYKFIFKNVRGLFDKSNPECFEIGCFPGNLLSVFGEFGFLLNGIDFTARVQDDFVKWLKKSGYNVGRIIYGDFLKYKITRKFDLVCSFGFIEHFENFSEIIDRHITLVKPGGYLVITAPNFRGGIQNLLHRTFDKDNLLRHNINSMNPKIWKQQIASQGFDILYSGYYGGFAFWTDHSNNSVIGRKIAGLIAGASRYFGWLPNSSVYSPFCAIVCRKKVNEQ